MEMVDCKKFRVLSVRIVVTMIKEILYLIEGGGAPFLIKEILYLMEGGGPPFLVNLNFLTTYFVVQKQLRMNFINDL